MMNKEIKELVEGIVRNYYGQIDLLRSMGKYPTITLKEHLEGIMLTEPKVYSQANIEYGLEFGASLERK